MEEIVKQSDKKFKEIGENQHYSFLIEFFLKWNSVDQLTEDKLEDWNSDVETIKKTLNYLPVKEVCNCPFGIAYKVWDTLVFIAIIQRSYGLIEFVPSFR